MRSKRAVDILLEHNILNCFSIVEGAAEIQSKIKEHNNMLLNER
ncbi:hypothetical protein JCM19300_773 [Algibacter lectus]|nr:hypothetical protein JCM19300_773 [Algibacter lectus]